eukprot:COSAG04_NODE_971_length_9098_cov_6.273253_6_plen_498_part_00
MRAESIFPRWHTGKGKERYFLGFLCRLSTMKPPRPATPGCWRVLPGAQLGQARREGALRCAARPEQPRDTVAAIRSVVVCVSVCWSIPRQSDDLTRRNCCAGRGSKVDAPELALGPGWTIQELSRVGAQGATSKSKLLAFEMPRVCCRGLLVDSGEDCRRKGGCAGRGSKVNAPELALGPIWEIQELSRVGAQGVTSKSKLLAFETSVLQRLPTRFLGNLTRRNCSAGPDSKVDAPEAFSGPGWEIQELSRVGAQGVTSKSKLLAREFHECAAEACGSVPRQFDAAKLLCVAKGQSRCAGARLGTYMGDTGAKSGRRPGRHLQVEASGLRDAASVQPRLVGRFGGNLTRRNCCAGRGSKVDAPEASSGPGWKIQEVSRAGAQGVTSKSKLLTREMPRVSAKACWSIPGLFDAAKLLCVARGQSRCAGARLGTCMEDTGAKSGRRSGRHLQVEASGPGDARVCNRGLLVDSGAAPRRKCARAGQRVDRSGSYAYAGPV